MPTQSHTPTPTAKSYQSQHELSKTVKDLQATYFEAQQTRQQARSDQQVDER